jgi:hypothetical protein
MNITREMLNDAVTKPKKTFVYSFGCNTRSGFGADYLGFIAKLMQCLQLGIGFRFCKITKPQGFITRNGWTDYFEPFCGEVTAPLLERLNLHAFPYARIIPFTKYVVGFWLRLTSRPMADYFAFDNLGKFEKLGPPLFEDNENYLLARRDLIRILWKYNIETRREVAIIKQEVEVPNEYIGICVRRGDKNTEHAYVGIDQYVAMINALHSGARTIFIATDDVLVVKEISKAMPNHQFISLTESHASGYVHSEFKSLTSAERRRRTLRFFVQLELMRDAGVFIGSKTTNVSWMVNAHRGGEGVIWVD